MWWADALVTLAPSNLESLAMNAFLPTITTTCRRLLLCALCLVLAACGGENHDAGTGPAGAPATAVGSAGGTVTGAQGARVSIAPGALAGTTLITVAQTDVGAPPLTEGLSALGAMFAFTPHGTTFGVPATITLPFDPASVPAGRTPALYKTNAQNEWEHLASATFGTDSVSAQVTGFSYAQVVLAPLQRNDPERAWGFVEVNILGFQDIPAPQGRGLQIGGVLDQKISFGRTAFDGPPLTDGTSLPVDGQANGHIFASADGISWSVAAEAPFERQTAVSAIGGEAHLGHAQSFIKRSDDARLSYTITRVVLRGGRFPAVGTQRAGQ